MVTNHRRACTVSLVPFCFSSHTAAIVDTDAKYSCTSLTSCTTPVCGAEYRLVAKKGEGTFSEVLKAQCIKNSKYVAIKCMKNHFDSLEQVALTMCL